MHALFNNAGVADTPAGAHGASSVNYLALRTLSEGLLDRMPEGGAIVNTASIAGNLWRKRVDPINALLDLDIADGWAATLEWFDDAPADARPGAVQLLEGARGGVHDALVASDDATGVRTNSVCPGPIDTPLLPDFRADDERQDRRLEHPRDERPAGLAARGRHGARVPRLAGRGVRQRREPRHRRRLHRRDRDGPGRLQRARRARRSLQTWPTRPRPMSTSSSSAPGSRASTCCTTSASSASRRRSSRPATASAAPGTGTATRVPAATSRAWSTPTGSPRSSSRSGSGPSATPRSRSPRATSTTSPTASTCGATSS